MTEVVAALIWNKDKFMICQCPGKSQRPFVDTRIFCLCAFQNLFFNKTKKRSVF